MDKLADKLDNALEEARMLVLGVQVLIGFDFQAAFQPGFARLPPALQALKLVGLGFQALALALLLALVPYHQVRLGGRSSERLQRMATRLINTALLPFALGLGIDVTCAAATLLRPLAAAALGALALLTALVFWYGLEWRRAASRAGRRSSMDNDTNEAPAGATPLSTRIKHLLTEARVILPGAQALLGFQFTIMLTDGFGRLPESSKLLHLASLLLVALAAVLLMATPAYHRLAEQGEDTLHFERFAARAVLASLVPLGLAICGDLFVVARTISGDTLALVLSLGMLALIVTLWLGLALARRRPAARQLAAGRSGEELHG